MDADSGGKRGRGDEEGEGGERKEARETVDAGQRQTQTDPFCLRFVSNHAFFVAKDNFTSQNDWYVWEV